MRSPELRTDENRERNHQGETDTRLYISILLQRDDCTKCQIYKEEGYNTINHLKKKKKNKSKYILNQYQVQFNVITTSLDITTVVFQVGLRLD